MLSDKNLDILETIARFAGKSVITNEDGIVSFEDLDRVYCEKVEILKREHGDLVDLFCVGVPGKSFFIRSNGEISVTGNTMHTEAMIKLFRLYVEENRKDWNDSTKGQIYSICEKMVELEDQFIDLAFQMGSIQGLRDDEVKKYIRYIADRRLISMGLKGIYKVKKNPLPWVETLINAPIHTNFFENRSTDYAKGALKGSWEDIWG